MLLTWRRERIEDAERKLSSTRLKLGELSREVTRLAANGGTSPAVNLASTRSELAGLFKKMKHVAQVRGCAASGGDGE